MSEAKGYRAFRQLDTIRTPTGEWLFMAVATGLVLVGIPVALAAIFRFVLPALGSLWTP